jgi:inosine/xanthosine triphosphatase
MKIAVGSKNAAKVNAVAEILQDYSHLSDAEVMGFDVSSEISPQPLTLEETLRGARNRAKNAFDQGADYGVGIESGLIEVPYSKSGYMDITTAAVYDGTDYHLGISSAWEFANPEIFRAISSGEGEMTDVLVERGIFADQSERAANGAIHFATKGRLDRKTYTKQALQMALIHIDQ